MDRTTEIERSIHKRFRQRLWAPFISAIKRYELVKEGEKIAVCISGGKDSFLMAKLFSMLQRISDFPFSLEYLVMDPGYSPKNREKIVENAKLLNIPVTFFETKIFDIANSADSSPCYLCARMRRGALYAKAKELGCSKIALGHHFNDVIETTLIGMFYSSQLKGMMPKLHSQNFEGMELIRPMYCIREDDIISWAEANDLIFLRCACRFTEETESIPGGSKRKEVKELIRELKKTNPDIESSIFNSIHAVSVDTFPGIKTLGHSHSFLEDYYDR